MATKAKKSTKSAATSTTSKKKKKTSTASTTTTTAKKKKKGSTKASTTTTNKKINKALTRAQQIAYVSEQTALSKKDVSAVIDSFESMIASHLRGPGQISFAGLMKVVAVRKPATKARKGVNPFTGEPTTFKAKPARNVVKIRALKKVKDLVA
jgi:nucleoid DNA-binding protein